MMDLGACNDDETRSSPWHLRSSILIDCSTLLLLRYNLKHLLAVTDIRQPRTSNAIHLPGIAENMAFDNLPATILSNIISFLSPPLAQYATISHSWKPVIEAFTFRELHIDSAKRLHQLNDIVTYNRRKAIRKIILTALLPEYGSEVYGSIENEEDRKRNNAVFTQAFRNLFQTLRFWQYDAVGDGKGSCRSGGITLIIRAFSKSDAGNMADATEKKRRVYYSGDEDIGATRFEASYLHLDGELPEVGVVSELEVYGRNDWVSDDLTCDPRPISGEAVARLMGCLTRLKRAHIQLSDEESRDMALREREREGKTIRPNLSFCNPR
jgi:hypothetical protein